MNAPVAVADILSATEDTPVTYTAADLLGNDTDVDTPHDQLTIASVTSGAGGLAVLNLDGTVTFTPDANFNGAANFTYTVSDGSLTSNPATVTVNVAAVNDAPVAAADTLAATEDTQVTYTAAQLLGNDTDVDGNPLTIASVTSAAGGSAVLNANGTVTFTPDANFNGPASFTYTASDGSLTSNPATVTVNVAPVNDAPVGAASASLAAGSEDTAYTVSAADLLAGFSDVDGDALSVAALSANHGSVVDNRNGTFTITPAANYNGAVSLSYNVVDGNGGSVAASQSFTLAAVNDAPAGAASASLAAGSEDTAYTVSAADLLAGFSDVDGDALSVAALWTTRWTTARRRCRRSMLARWSATPSRWRA